jgi:hypothetical protein
MISRVHAHIAHLSNDQWKLRDNRSVNGIYVNSIKVGEAILNDGDVITFGGGGNAAFGSTKEQPEAEFIYKFSCSFWFFFFDRPTEGRSSREKCFCYRYPTQLADTGPWPPVVFPLPGPLADLCFLFFLFFLGS